MLIEFFTWYGRQMAGLLPSLAARGDARGNALVVELERLPASVAEASQMNVQAGMTAGMTSGLTGGLAGGLASAGLPLPVAPSVRLLLRRRNGETPLGRFVLEGAGLAAARAALAGRRVREVALRLPRGMLLERAVTLPLAAETSIERVVGFEIDRYTPFAADEVFWSVQVRARDRAQGRLQAAITLVPRQGLQPVLDALAGIGLRVGSLEGEVPGADGSIGANSSVGAGTRRLLSLARRDERAERVRRRRLIAAAALCAACAAVAVAVPFLRQSWALDRLNARIAAFQPQLDEAEALRGRLSARQAGSDVIAGEQRLVSDALQAIAALTDILPNDTFLTGLVLQKRQVSIEGQSANAARLIGLLSADPVIRNAAFAAPVTRNDSGADLFSIKADVRP